jgi:CheY-like chemotaxis protein
MRGRFIKDQHAIMALRINVLVAEDDLHDQILWDNLIVRSSTVFVYYVWSGDEVINYLSGQGPFAAREKYPYPDILFLDVEMPKINGLQVLEWLAANPAVKRPDIYICTGVSASPVREKLEKHPIKGLFVKPLSQAQVKDIIEKRLLV